MDNWHLSIIQKNSIDIEKMSKNLGKIEGKSDEELTELYFRELGDTRNYYSHYKLDTAGVLNNKQMLFSIDVLKATIISIFFSHMKMEKELIRKIIAFDSELHWITKCLRNEADRPFKHPCAVTETQDNPLMEER